MLTPLFWPGGSQSSALRHQRHVALPLRQPESRPGGFKNLWMEVKYVFLHSKGNVQKIKYLPEKAKCLSLPQCLLFSAHHRKHWLYQYCYYPKVAFDSPSLRRRS